MEKLIKEDPAAAEEWYYLRKAVDAIQQTGLYQQVEEVRMVWMRQTAVADKPTGGVIRTMYRNALRVAACLFILSGAAALYKYTTTTPGSFYEKYYTGYNLNTSRGVEATDAQEQAYTGKNWANVLSTFDGSKTKGNKAYFLAGMADLELKKYDDAIDKFQHIIAANSLSGGDYYQDEAEFYLAMSWMGRGDANEATPLLEKIKANKNHLYHDVVVKMSSLDLGILDRKSSK
jgi:tetratricopeptide (TPR) repeat protein